MAQQLEAHTALAKDRSLIPRNHKKQHTTTYNSSLAELDTLLWLLVEMVVEESGGQSQPQIQSGVEASLRYINLCQKKKIWMEGVKQISQYIHCARRLQVEKDHMVRHLQLTTFT